mmetsp:Transcript_17801/g.42621  ORF Transcript_17801/g.42621 Transcript_17801/m.42621 type:complete len:233 (+) Transcript_17801:528-1226(+)
MPARLGARARGGGPSAGQVHHLPAGLVPHAPGRLRRDAVGRVHARGCGPVSAMRARGRVSRGRGRGAAGWVLEVHGRGGGQRLWGGGLGGRVHVPARRVPRGRGVQRGPRGTRMLHVQAWLRTLGLWLQVLPRPCHRPRALDRRRRRRRRLARVLPRALAPVSRERPRAGRRAGSRREGQRGCGGRREPRAARAARVARAPAARVGVSVRPEDADAGLRQDCDRVLPDLLVV